MFSLDHEVAEGDAHVEWKTFSGVVRPTVLTAKAELIRLILDLCRDLVSWAAETLKPKLRSLLFLGLSAGAVAGAGSFACAAFGGGTFSAGIDGGCDTDIFMDVVACQGSTSGASPRIC